jgi:hypothetical protein
MHTTPKQDISLPACAAAIIGVQRAKHQTSRLEELANLPFKEKPPHEGNRADGAGQTAGPAIRGSHSSQRRGQRKAAEAAGCGILPKGNSGPECSKPSAGPQNRRMKNEI